MSLFLSTLLLLATSLLPGYHQAIGPPQKRQIQASIQGTIQNTREHEFLPNKNGEKERKAEDHLMRMPNSEKAKDKKLKDDMRSTLAKKHQQLNQQSKEFPIFLHFPGEGRVENKADDKEVRGVTNKEAEIAPTMEGEIPTMGGEIPTMEGEIADAAKRTGILNNFIPNETVTDRKKMKRKIQIERNLKTLTQEVNKKMEKEVNKEVDKGVVNEASKEEVNKEMDTEADNVANKEMYKERQQKRLNKIEATKAVDKEMYKKPHQNGFKKSETRKEVFHAIPNMEDDLATVEIRTEALKKRKYNYLKTLKNAMPLKSMNIDKFRAQKSLKKSEATKDVSSSFDSAAARREIISFAKDIGGELQRKTAKTSNMAIEDQIEEGKKEKNEGNNHWLRKYYRRLG